MSPDRLAELRRQRALVAQHLAWIDAELTAAGANVPPQATPPPASSPTAASATALPNTPAEALPAEPVNQDPSIVLANARADEIIEKYRATEALDPQSTKRGCLVLFGAIFVLGGALLLAIYYFGYASK